MLLSIERIKSYSRLAGSLVMWFGVPVVLNHYEYQYEHIHGIVVDTYKAWRAQLPSARVIRTAREVEIYDRIYGVCIPSEENAYRLGFSPIKRPIESLEVRPASAIIMVILILALAFISIFLVLHCAKCWSS